MKRVGTDIRETPLTDIFSVIMIFLYYFISHGATEHSVEVSLDWINPGDLPLISIWIIDSQGSTIHSVFLSGGPRLAGWRDPNVLDCTPRQCPPKVNFARVLDTLTVWAVYNDCALPRSNKLAV